MSTTSTTSHDFYLIGIGASAGGLEALEVFFEHMPPNNGMAFVVVQHLSPDYKSMMVEILSKRTTLKVFEATDETSIQANCIYLIPPKKYITVYNKKLYLTEKETHRGLTLPIDIFFHSLAQDFGRYAIAIVLSGTGSDGTRGIRSIKEADGMVMVQKEDTAKFDGMPKNAIATGLADFILSPEKMPDALLNFTQHPHILQKSSKDEHVTDSEEETLAKILEVVKEQSDVNFAHYKTNTMLRRIERRMGINQLNKLTDYLRYLQRSPQEVKILYKELLIGVTKFFRDTDAFEALSELVIPKIFTSKNQTDTIRVWVAGCSTGEEAYSLAILFSEYKQKENSPVDVKIFATDIDTTAIDTASAGRYPETISHEVSPERLQRFFIQKEDNQFEVVQKIRKMVIFSPHDLIKNPPFGKMDLISCRNLFIYLQPILQEKILQFFHFSLKPHGYLFLGSSETINEDLKLFNSLDKKHKIYQYKIDYNLPKYPTIGLGNAAVMVPKVNALVAHSPRVPQPNYDELLYETLVHKYVPPCVIMDEHLNVLHFHGRLDAYLHLPQGRANLNLAKMLHEDVAMIFQTAIRSAMKKNQDVIYTLPPTPMRPSTRLRIEPLRLLKKGAPNWFAVIFDEVSNVEPKSTQLFDIQKDFDKRLIDLENELQHTRETLQAALEEVETSNEELQATNEELLASNEELQSTNEELQAVNEELVTLNAEHQHKIQELSELNDDINNLLRSTNIGTVFLDSHLCIKRFTPAIVKEFNIRESDIGRPLAHLSHYLKYEHLLEDLQAVLERAEIKKVKVDSKKGGWYLLQFSPYIASEETAQGVVVTLVNITEELEEQRRTLLTFIVDSAAYAILSTDAEGHISSWNKGAETILGYSSEEIQGQPLHTKLVLPPLYENILQLFAEVRSGKPIEHYKTLLLSKNQKVIPVSLSLTRIDTPDQPGSHGISIIGRDLRESQKLEEELRAEREFQYEFTRQLMEISTAGILMVNQAGECIFANPAAQKLLGLSKEYIGLLPHDPGGLSRVTAELNDLSKETEWPFARVITLGQPVSGQRLLFHRADGQDVWLSVNATRWENKETQQIYGVIFYLEELKP